MENIYAVTCIDMLNDTDSGSGDRLETFMHSPIYGTYDSPEKALEQSNYLVREQLSDLLGDMPKNWKPDGDNGTVKEFKFNERVLGYYIEPFGDGNFFAASICKLFK